MKTESTLATSCCIIDVYNKIRLLYR